jgi:hypothetical protein
MGTGSFAFVKFFLESDYQQKTYLLTTMQSSAVDIGPQMLGFALVFMLFSLVGDVGTLLIWQYKERQQVCTFIRSFSFGATVFGSYAFISCSPSSLTHETQQTSQDCMSRLHMEFKRRSYACTII